MTISGFLPQRWRPNPETACHAEAIAGVLHTRPLEPAKGGPAIVSLLGTADVLPYLVAIKSLRGRLGRGRIVVIDGGTLTGEDRAILAHHCGDPEIMPHQAVRRGAFPPGGAWALLLTILDRRAGQYWIALDPHTVTLGDLPEVEAAIASNRSFTALSGETPDVFAAVCEARGWRYQTGCSGLTGFAAGGTGRTLALAFHEAAAGLGDGDTAAAARNVLLANEAEPVLLPAVRYARAGERPWADYSSWLQFPEGPLQGQPYAEASRAAIALLPR